MPLSYRLLQSLLLYVNLILLRLLGEVKVVSHLYAKVKVTQALCIGIRSGEDIDRCGLVHSGFFTPTRLSELVSLR